ncbi:GerAB/ArcD/ProY family transporter [Paenibacillus sp. strain BS8-2]
MIGKEQISGRQFALLIAYISIGDTFLVTPSIPTIEAGRDSWLSALAGIMFGIIVVCFQVFLAKKHAGQSLVDILESRFGRWGGLVITVFFLIYLMVSVSAHVREIGDFMTTQMMVETPIHSIHILYALVIVLAARLGLEPIARTSEFFFPWLMLFLIVFILFLLPNIHWDNFFPIMEKGVKPILRGSVTMTSYSFMELGVMLMLLPHLKKGSSIGKNWIKGSLFGGAVIAAIIVLSIAILGEDLASRSMYPGYVLAKKNRYRTFPAEN